MGWVVVEHLEKLGSHALWYEDRVNCFQGGVPSSGSFCASNEDPVDFHEEVRRGPFLCWGNLHVQERDGLFEIFIHWSDACSCLSLLIKA